jgi:hypothetical protein
LYFQLVLVLLILHYRLIISLRPAVAVAEMTLEVEAVQAACWMDQQH